MPEHIAQVIQRFVFGLSPAQSSGIIGALDLEPVHFVYNISLMALILVTCFGLGFHKKGSPLRGRPLLFYSFWGSMAIQSYHSVEHTAKIIQFAQTGIQGTPGIVGLFEVNLIWFHFGINLVVYLLMLAALISIIRLNHVSSGLYKTSKS